MEDFGAERDAAKAGASEVLAEIKAERAAKRARGEAAGGQAKSKGSDATTRRLVEALGRGSCCRVS